MIPRATPQAYKPFISFPSLRHLLCLLLLAMPIYSQPIAIRTLPVRANGAIVANTVTNKIYVANDIGVSVIDGATNTFLTIRIPYVTTAIAVNEVTNKIYVASASTVYVIDGSTNSVISMLGADLQQSFLAVNPVTNKIYGNSLVIDGVTNTIFPFYHPLYGSSLEGSISIAVNPVTNAIYQIGIFTDYVFEYGFYDFKQYQGILALNGVKDFLTSDIYNGQDSFSNDANTVAVNPVTNKVYIADPDGLVVLDGATQYTQVATLELPAPKLSLPALAHPLSLAINSVTNKIYVSNTDYFNNNIVVIDGATNTTTTIPSPSAGAPSYMAVNAVTNKIYGVNGSNITVVDGATNTLTNVFDGNAASPSRVAVNPVTNKIYVSNAGSNNVTVLDGNVSLLSPPSCQLSSITAGPPTQLTVAMQANGSGLQSIKVVEDRNASINIPVFSPGTTSTVFTTATKLDQTASSNVGFYVTNMAGLTTSCDPADFTLELNGAREQHVFRSLPASEHYVRIVNGTPGVHHITFLVNGHSFSAPALKDGETYSLDIGSAMVTEAQETVKGQKTSVRGVGRENNNVVMYATGVRGASAYVLIGDASVQ